VVAKAVPTGSHYFDLVEEFRRTLEVRPKASGNSPRYEREQNITDYSGESCCNLAPICRPETQNVGYLDAKPRSSLRYGAVISLEEACCRYLLSEEEFRAWERDIEVHGVAGLRSTRLQIYRKAPAPDPDKPRY